MNPAILRHNFNVIHQCMRKQLSNTSRFSKSPLSNWIQHWETTKGFTFLNVFGKVAPSTQFKARQSTWRHETSGFELNLIIFCDLSNSFPWCHNGLDICKLYTYSKEPLFLADPGNCCQPCSVKAYSKIRFVSIPTTVDTTISCPKIDQTTSIRLQHPDKLN